MEDIMILDVLTDSLIDTVKLLPFLFLTYLAMEYLEHKSGEKTSDMMKNTGKGGPLLAACLGAVPQCGFSAAAAGLYSGGVITMGTLLAVFLSTSDEMLPIFISEAVAASRIFKLLGAKILMGAVSGFLLDFLMKAFSRKEEEKDIHDLCEHDHCHCERGIVRPALDHTWKVTLFIFVLTFFIGLGVEAIGRDALSSFLGNAPVLGVFLSALIGLIPNCAASVAVTELYLEGMLGAGQMMAGLLVGAGVGLLVLFRSSQHWKENAAFTAILYITGVLWGLLIEFSGVVF